MLLSEDIEVIARYKGFTKKTKFLVEEGLAERTLIGNIAVAKKSIGKGHLYIFGPHFEHPHYPTCNLFLAQIIYENQNGRPQTIQKDPPGEPVKGEVLRELLKDLKRELSNSRIMASGMEDFSTNWLIGNKYYEPEKISVFINTVWNKLKDLESTSDLEMEKESLLRCIEISKHITRKVRTIKSEMREKGDTTFLASELFLDLKALSSNFFTLYFKVKRDRFRNHLMGG